MKILMINVVCGIRSTGRICTDLATALEDQGHEVKIAYGREEVPEQFQRYAVRIGTDLDVEIHGVLARTLDASGFGSKSATKKFIEWVKDFDPDVIHLHNIHGYYINIEILFNYLRNCRKKIIWTLHDCWASTGHSAYCDAIGCEKWKTGCSHCPNLKEYPKSYLDFSNRNWKRKRELFNEIPELTIVTPSNWLAGLVKASFLSDYPLTVIHNGIDTSQFYPLKSDFREKYGIGNKFILLGVATTWEERKGLNDYYELASSIGNEYQVVLVGLSKTQLRRSPSNIIGLERTNNIRELVNIYCAADLYVNLSYDETFGLTNVEAQLCGKPVVGYDSGAMKESIAQGGIIVPRGDIPAVARAIHLIKNKSFIPHLVNNSRVDKKLSIKSYLSIFED